MFRNPRESASVAAADGVRPSVGRPPTPPSASGTSKATGSPHFPMPTINTRSMPIASRTPVLGRQSTAQTTSVKKNGLKQNQSILSFFGKAERADQDSAASKNDLGLFFNETAKDSQRKGSVTETGDIFNTESSVSKPLHPASQSSRFNEDDTPVKKRRMDYDDPDFMVRTPSPERDQLATEQDSSEIDDKAALLPESSPVNKRRGGFVDDSDEEDEEPENDEISEDDVSGSTQQDSKPRPEHQQSIEDLSNNDTEDNLSTVVPLRHTEFDKHTIEDYDVHERTNALDDFVPALSREGTSMFALDEFGDEDFENDEFFEEGEEFMERRWMQEQREMEVELDEDSKSESGADSVRTPRSNFDDDFMDTPITSEAVARCPICNGSMKDLSEAQASSHVNACLDGAAPPLPDPDVGGAMVKKEQITAPASGVSSTTYVAGTKRFQRAAIARPGQSNPFAMSKEGKGGSAFTRLMSGHAEDAAWAEAAANEAQSRGKPAYQRTCPFYKIMPGFYICVDAFRYGKVEGQNAYFLSHFHSDHYIGLTSSWCHGPIYASKVTCNLMRQQLRVDPRWIVPLEFEKKVEVPHTKGVFVTMIPANHCPGSSLYLFEKTIGKNRDSSLKMTRVLHCGDFRACPAHVNHPLLRPDVVDAVSGQNRQQLIDTCYLDTTYLTPKYSFPSQQDVIDACAQMCVSMAKEIVDSGDNWEKVKVERAGSTMTKFLEQGERKTVKNEEEEQEQKPKLRGRLLVVIGTYSIGKERICLGIAKALDSKIYAPPPKMKICAALEDPDLNSRLTSNPLEAQVHMQTLMEIRAETLHDYLVTYHGHFARVVGFRPTGWSYRPPTSRFTENPAVNTVLRSEGWKSRFTMHDLTPQRGSTKESNCFGVPYSEHSSFRELTMFCCALRINRVVPTVNVGSARSREKMKGWIEKWDTEKKKNGLFQVEVGAEGWGSGDGQLRYGV